ncbi:hypothetical protein J6590_028786 [Homalodisca vitripennis]|nr:hypothetical protein J6590_028786 [Homalodisca vitripennis]
MDFLIVLLLSVGVALFSGLIIYFILVSTMKEKTYDEVKAEQKKKAEEYFAQGRSAKEKAKDKKLKKAGKKVKEKTTTESVDMSSEEVDSSKAHVAFVEPPTVVDEEPPVIEEKKRKKNKKKEKPILVNKNEITPVVEVPPLIINHFEQIIPKDDFLLKRNSICREEVEVKVEPSVISTQKQLNNKHTKAQAIPPKEPKVDKSQPQKLNQQPPKPEKEKVTAPSKPTEKPTNPKQVEKTAVPPKPVEKPTKPASKPSEKPTNLPSKQSEKPQNPSKSTEKPAVALKQQEKPNPKPQDKPQAQPKPVEEVVVVKSSAKQAQSAPVVNVEHSPSTTKSSRKKRSELATLQQMILNELKTQQLNFGRRTVELTGLPEVDLDNKAKYLGVTIDDKLTWTPHIDHLCSKLNSCIYVLNTLYPEPGYRSGSWTCSSCENGAVDVRARHTAAAFILPVTLIARCVCFGESVVCLLIMEEDDNVIDDNFSSDEDNESSSNSSRDGEDSVPHPQWATPPQYCLCRNLMRCEHIQHGDRHRMTSRLGTDMMLPVPANEASGIPWTTLSAILTPFWVKNKKIPAFSVASGDREAINVNLLMPLVHKAELSRTEIQVLIDLLLNKQQGSSVDSAEWIEGRQDPVVKLKKQLAEKEKALAAEQEAATALQSKLRELRSELNAEKHSTRQLEESLQARQSELGNLAGRLQHSSEEKQSLLQQIQQLQGELSDEHMMLCKLQEDQGQTQSVMQQELLAQRQQLELHIARLTEQHQEFGFSLL